MNIEGLVAAELFLRGDFPQRVRDAVAANGMKVAEEMTRGRVERIGQSVPVLQNAQRQLAVLRPRIEERFGCILPPGSISIRITTLSGRLIVEIYDDHYELPR